MAMQASTPSGSPGMDAVVVEEDGAAFGFDLCAVVHAVGADHARMHGDAAVRYTDLLKPQHLREALRQLLVERDAFSPEGGLVLIAFFVRRRHVWMHGCLISEEVGGIGRRGPNCIIRACILSAAVAPGWGIALLQAAWRSWCFTGIA
jgi:hypothetical protein